MNSLNFKVLEDTLCLAHELVNQSYLALPMTCAIPLAPSPSPCNFTLLKIKHTTCQNDAQLLSFAYILSALHQLDATLCYIIDVTPTTLTTYIGVQNTIAPCVATDLLIKGISKAYQGAKYEIVKDTDFIKWDSLSVVTSTTFMPNTPLAPSCTAPILGPFIQLTEKSTYTLMLLAKPISKKDYRCRKEALQNLYTTLYPFNEINYTDHHHDNEVHTDTSTCNHTHNQTDTCNKSNGTSCSSTLSSNTNDSSSTTLKQKDLLIVSKNASTTNNDSRTNTCNENLSDSCSKQKNDSKGTTCTETCTTIDIHTLNFRTRNLEVTDLLEVIPLKLKRYEETLYLPMFNFNTYFLSCDSTDALFAASSYMSLLQVTDALNPSYLNHWFCEDTGFIPIIHTLKDLKQPLFCINHLDTMTPGIALAADELNTLVSPLILASKSEAPRTVQQK